MIPGTIVSMGGKDWEIPPLTLGMLRRLMPKIRDLPEIGVGMGDEQIGILCEIVAQAMSRNYPDMTQESVGELLDLVNAHDIVSIVLTGSGLKPGEAAAVAARTNGALSTDSLLPLADTATP